MFITIVSVLPRAPLRLINGHARYTAQLFVWDRKYWDFPDKSEIAFKKLTEKS